jgi:hypothetical protein
MGLCHYWLYFGRGHSAGYCGSCGQTGGVGHFRDVIPDCSCCVSHRRLLCQISCSRCPDFSWFPATERRGCSFSQFWPTSTSGLHRLRGECVQSVKQCVRCSERDIECGAVSENVGSTVMHCCHTDLWAEGRQSGSTPQVRVREGRFPLCWRMPSAIRFSTDGAHIPAPPTSGSLMNLMRGCRTLQMDLRNSGGTCCAYKNLKPLAARFLSFSSTTCVGQKVPRMQERDSALTYWTRRHMHWL